MPPPEERGRGTGFSRIGFYIQRHVRAFQWDKAATLTVVVLVMVIAIGQLSVCVRRRLREPLPKRSPKRTHRAACRR